MKRIVSPWRMKYINGSNATPGCIFCNLSEGTHEDRERLIVQRGKLAFVMLNRYPYTSGHLMVAPYAHLNSIELLDAATQGEMMALISRAVEVLREVYHPEGFNIGANLGCAAGAGFAGHIHFHIVPRWGGDTNFMTTLGDVRVLPEDLETTWQRICEDWEKRIERLSEQ